MEMIGRMIDCSHEWLFMHLTDNRSEYGLLLQSADLLFCWSVLIDNYSICVKGALGKGQTSWSPTDKYKEGDVVYPLHWFHTHSFMPGDTAIVSGTESVYVRQIEQT